MFSFVYHFVLHGSVLSCCVLLCAQDMFAICKHYSPLSQTSLRISFMELFSTWFYFHAYMLHHIVVMNADSDNTICGALLSTTGILEHGIVLLLMVSHITTLCFSLSADCTVHNVQWLTPVQMHNWMIMIVSLTLTPPVCCRAHQFVCFRLVWFSVFSACVILVYREVGG